MHGWMLCTLQNELTLIIKKVSICLWWCVYTVIEHEKPRIYVLRSHSHRQYEKRNICPFQVNIFSVEFFHREQTDHIHHNSTFSDAFTHSEVNLFNGALREIIGDLKKKIVFNSQLRHFFFCKISVPNYFYSASIKPYCVNRQIA